MNQAIRCSGIFGLVMLSLSALSLRAEEDRGVDQAAVQGRWIRHQRTGDGVITVLKEHDDGTTTLTAYDSQKNVIYAKTSRYRLEKVGTIRIFRFSGNRITAGPGAGRVSDTEKAFIYRVEKDRFIEVRGMLDEVPEDPEMIVWERDRSVPESETATEDGGGASRTPATGVGVADIVTRRGRLAPSHSQRGN